MSQFYEPLLMITTLVLVLTVCGGGGWGWGGGCLDGGHLTMESLIVEIQKHFLELSGTGQESVPDF